MERFARAIGGLGKISQEVLDAVIVEFLELLTTGPEISGGSKAARKLLAAVLDDEDEVQRLIDGRRRSEVRSVWERLNDTPAPTLANFLQAEHPQTAAVVLSELRAEVAASVLERLERGFAQTVVLRLSRVPTLDPPIAAAIQGAIERDFLSVLQRNLSKRRPADLIAGLMNNISTEVREGFLSYLEAQEPSLAQDVQRTMFTFEDIAVRLHGRDVAGVLRDVRRGGAAEGAEARRGAGQRHRRLRPREPAAPALRALRRGAGRPDRRQPQGGRIGPDRDHQGDPGPGQGRRDPLHREGQRLRLTAERPRSTALPVRRSSVMIAIITEGSMSNRQGRRARSSARRTYDGKQASLPQGIEGAGSTGISMVLLNVPPAGGRRLTGTATKPRST